MTIEMLGDILGSTIIFAIPLMLVALGGMFSERSGVINIALEGIMIIGALIGCLVLRTFNLSGFGPAHPIIAMLITIGISALAGAVFSLLLAFATINLKADQTIGGTALNMLAPAFAVVLSWAIQGQGNTVINIPTWIRMTESTFGLAEGTGFWHNLIFKSLYLTTPIALVILLISIIILYKTKFGLRLRACGEHPQAAASVGINVYKMRYAGVIISGILGGIGGMAYTIAAGAGFQSSVAGYGFLALAVMIFGNWKPVSIFFASMFFAFFKILGNYSGSLSFLPQFENIKDSNYIYLMIPYIVTLIVLVLTSKKSAAPKAEGIPYDKGQR